MADGAGFAFAGQGQHIGMVAADLHLRAFAALVDVLPAAANARGMRAAVGVDRAVDDLDRSAAGIALIA